MTRRLALLCLAALAGGCQRKKKLEVDEQEPAVPAGRPFPHVPAADVTAVRIEKLGAPTVVLRRDGERWLIAEPEAGVADPTAIAFALREIERIEFDAEPVGGQADRERLGVTDAEVVTLRVTTSSGALPALHLGPRRHLRIGDAPAVWRAHHIDHFTFNRELRLWR